MERSAQFPCMPQESVIDENSRAVRIYINFQLSRHGRPDVASFLLHFDGYEEQFLWFHGKCLREILIPSLPNGQLMIAGQQHDSFVAPQLAQISDIFSVN